MYTSLYKFVWSLFTIVIKSKCDRILTKEKRMFNSNIHKILIKEANYTVNIRVKTITWKSEGKIIFKSSLIRSLRFCCRPCYVANFFCNMQLKFRWKQYNLQVSVEFYMWLCKCFILHNHRWRYLLYITYNSVFYSV